MSYKVTLPLPVSHESSVEHMQTPRCFQDILAQRTYLIVLELYIEKVDVEVRMVLHGSIHDPCGDGKGQIRHPVW